MKIEHTIIDYLQKIWFDLDDRRISKQIFKSEPEETESKEYREQAGDKGQTKRCND